MSDLPFAQVLWGVAGFALGIAASMLVLALVLELDRRRVRRRLRATTAGAGRPGPGAAPEAGAGPPPDAPASLPALSVTENEPDAPPAITVAPAPRVVDRVEAPEMPGRPPSVEEMFARAFRAAHLPSAPPASGAGPDDRGVGKDGMADGG